MQLHQKFEVNHELLPNCPKHLEKDCELFCFKDKTIICSICGLTDHLNHKVMPIKEAALQFKNELKNIDYQTICGVVLENIQKSVEETKEKENFLEKLKKKFEEEKKKFEKEIQISKENENENRQTLKSIKEIENLIQKETNMQKIIGWKNLISNYSKFLQNIYAWGENSEFQLGFEDNEKLLPEKLDLTTSQQIVCGFRHTIVLSSNYSFRNTF